MNLHEPMNPQDNISCISAIGECNQIIMPKTMQSSCMPHNGKWAFWWGETFFLLGFQRTGRWGEGLLMVKVEQS